MKKWESYIGKQKSEYTRVCYPEDFNAGMVVVIPCYNEPDIEETLESLRDCHRPEVNVLVAIVINSSVLTDDAVVLQNRKTYNELKRFSQKYDDRGLSFFTVLFEQLPRKHAGVGLARKIGMDMAVAHFIRNGTRDGVIVSLDADCLVSKNYLTDIFTAFQRDPRLYSTIHQFRHRVERDDPILKRGIQQYEAYLRYFREMLKFTGFPYYYHTIGSAFAVLADAYVKVGGMGRQQGGEDFYFLQKLFEAGKTMELDNVVVYPLARYSDRVPFGTGPALEKIMQGADQRMEVYSKCSFLELKRLFDLVDDFYELEIDEIEAVINTLHPSLSSYLDEIAFREMIRDCKGNSARLVTFRKRFFHHFNAFRIIKYLNFVHPDPFPLEHIT